MVLTLVALIREFAPPAQILLGAMVVLMVAGVVDPVSALSGFSNSAMLTVGALFVVAAAVRKTGALSFLGHLMMPRSARMVALSLAASGARRERRVRTPSPPDRALALVRRAH